MKVVFDLEANSLTKPTNIWVVVFKDIASGQYEIFRKVTQDETEKQRLFKYLNQVSEVIGHHILGYDIPVLLSLLDYDCLKQHKCTDTLIVSKLFNYPRQGHSIEDYGEEFNLPKVKFNNFTEYSKEMEEYCVRDVDICHLIYNKYGRDINNPTFSRSINLEHDFQLVVNKLHDTGFCFNTQHASNLLNKIREELRELDEQILSAFPPKTALIREIHPERTKHGTLNRKDFKWVIDGDLSEFNGGPFSRFHWMDFNPSSHRQVIEVLNKASWNPVDKTSAHIETEREINQLKYKKDIDNRLEELYKKLSIFKIYGWKINEDNLATLPRHAPEPARLLAQRILLESRRRILTEWLGLVQDDGRIHGKFQGMGAWTHRMAHQQPNTANIPNDKDTQGRDKLYGGEFRSLWISPKKRLLVGVDAESIQLRIFAHYIDDREFTDALVRGSKADKTDPHSLNQKILGSVCKHRQSAKRFIYALLLGAGLNKLATVLECSESEAKEALEHLLQRYTGFAKLKASTIPKDAKAGYFKGLDGRKVIIPGNTIGQRKHLTMSGYLQNGEAVVMKMATLKWMAKLKELQMEYKLVNLVHDEWQTECCNNMEVAVKIAKIQANSLREVGEELNLKCPLAGSYWNDDRNDYTIGTNWKLTH